MAHRIDILLEDEDVIVVDKPAGLLSVAGRDGGTSLRDVLAKQLGDDFPLLLVHRLDRETSGVLLLARSTDAQRELSTQFQQRTVSKQYLALVQGSPDVDSGLILAPIGEHPKISGKMVITQKKGRPAETRFRVVERLGGITLVRCEPRTGRQHQIRVHLALANLPLLVDELYGDASAFYLSRVKPGYQTSGRHEERPLLDRLSLHAESLTFRHPRTGQPVVVEAPLPKDLRATLNQLRKLQGG